MLTELQDEFAFYRENQDRFVQEYDGRVVVLKNHEVLGDYDTKLAAVIETSKNHERGTFLVQQVSAGDEAYTMRFFSPGVATS